MLFALDWIERTMQAVFSAIFGLADSISIPFISDAMTSSWLVLVLCLLGGALLCFYGFRFHRMVYGVTAAILLGALGAHVGHLSDPGQLTISVVYAMVFAIIGFFFLHTIYVAEILAGSWYLFLAVIAPFAIQTHVVKYIIAAALAVAYSVLYMKKKMLMSTVTGAIILAVVTYALSPWLALIVLIGGTAAGIFAQRALYEKWRTKKLREAEEEAEDFPYGPGIAYGWPDPTLSRSREFKIK